LETDAMVMMTPCTRPALPLSADRAADRPEFGRRRAGGARDCHDGTGVRPHRREFLGPALGLATVACTTVAVALACRPAAGQAGSRDDRRAAGIDLDALIAAHNRERAEAKLPPLQPNPLLTAAAGEHARDMAEHRKLSHDGSDGSDPPKRVTRRGYRYQEVGENVAEGQTSVTQVMRTWMDSPPHRKNILGDYTEIGVAVAPDAEKILYWCAVFGRPRPKVDLGRSPAELIAALNRARADGKLAPVKEDAELVRVAESFARDLAARRRIDSKNRDGDTPFDVLQRRGYRARQFGLSLASGETDPAKLVRAGLERREERDQLLGLFDRIGVGVAADDDAVPYWVIVLARK
jgi:uncharacterized protein YkwD